MKKILVLLFAISMVAIGCKDDKKTKTVDKQPVKIVPIPKFNEDNAYKFIEEQLAFGFRYPGSEGHAKTVDYLAGKLEEYGAKVTRQKFTVDFLTKKNVSATNIIGAYNPEMKNRIMLAAHFDSRLIAEKAKDKKDQPIMGADDGASGVGVLLEIARLLKDNEINAGIDIVLFDAEDQGETGEKEVDTWCLGSQYWGKNPHVANYKADFGILLDMVGAKNARFGHEGISKQVAPQVISKVWTLAQNMGYGNYFQDFDAGGITDDHFYVIKHRKFPMIDIINRPVGETDHGFGHYHHTHDDNIDIIDKNTLKAVGKVVTAAIWNASMRRL